MFPPDALEALLILKARQGKPISYGDTFAWFGHAFQRFQVGQLCAALGEVDRQQRGQGRPDLAVLVVRQSDGLPGQGWWMAKGMESWTGPFVGPAAARHVAEMQRRAFDYWRDAFEHWRDA